MGVPRSVPREGRGNVARRCSHGLSHPPQQSTGRGAPPASARDPLDPVLVLSGSSRVGDACWNRSGRGTPPTHAPALPGACSSCTSPSQALRPSSRRRTPSRARQRARSPSQEALPEWRLHRSPAFEACSPAPGATGLPSLRSGPPTHPSVACSVSFCEYLHEDGTISLLISHSTFRSRTRS